MKIATNRQNAKQLVRNSKSVFYTHIAAPLYETTKSGDLEHHVIGRKYRGLFDENDGSFVALTQSRERDGFNRSGFVWVHSAILFN